MQRSFYSRSPSNKEPQISRAVLGSKGFPCGSAGKEFACNVGNLGSIPGLGRSPEEEKGYPLQYTGLQQSMDCIVHGVTKSRTRLSDFHRTALGLQVQWPFNESPLPSPAEGAVTLNPKITFAVIWE